MIGLGAAEMTVVAMMTMMFSGLWGVPVGLPPAPEDPVMQRVATEDCLFYATWSAMAVPKASSDNATERLLAEPEVRRFATHAYSLLERLADRVAVEERDQAAAIAAQLGTKSLRWVLTETGAIVVSDVKPNPESPEIRGSAVMRIGEAGRDVPALLLQLQRTAPPGVVSQVTVAGKPCYRLKLAEDAPELTWGVFDGYFVAGIGEGELDAAVARMKGEPPAWIAKMSEAVKVERRASFAYLNLKGITDLAREFAPPPVMQYVDGLGLGNLTALVSASGLEGDGLLSRTAMLIDGEPRGLLAPLTAAGLQPGELAAIPADALVAAGFRLDLARTLDQYLDTVGAIDARAAAEAREAIREMEEGLRLRLRQDLLEALGDTIYVYTAPGGGGILTGWTGVVEVKDRARLQRLHDMVLGYVRGAREAGAPFTVESFTANEQQVNYLVLDDAVPVTPAWCLTDKELVFGFFPQAVVAHTSRRSGGSLVEHAGVRSLWETGAAPLSFSYVDTVKLFEYGYPFLQVMASMITSEIREEGVDVSVALLPPPSALLPHLQPQISVTRRTDSGLEFVQRQTLPSGSVGASAPVMVALLLPAVQSARGAAHRVQSSNNLKMMGLAMHNFHDVHRTLPAAYNTDANGNPLLSWRVHILPFIEQQNLYDRFHLDEPWDSPHNRELIPLMPEVYRSPRSAVEPGMTTYLAPRGEQTVIAPPRPGEDGKPFPRATRFADIIDGTSNTIAVVEASDEEAVIWSKPDDLEIDLDEPAAGLGVFDGGNTLVLLMDGSVQALSVFVDPDTLRALFTRNGGEAVPFPFR